MGQPVYEFRHPLLNGLFSVRFCGSAARARVANQTGRAAFQRSRFVPAAGSVSGITMEPVASGGGYQR